MDQTITFDKSLQQRLQEYEDVLSGYETLPVSAIKKEWGFYLELTVDPNGWQAIWKIQRKTCEALDIPFPSLVLVLVLGVDFSELTALVKVIAVQDDIHIPDKHHAPLIQLWPTKDQDRTIALNLETTANSLDMVRFFYHYLLMPWDYEDDDGLDWKAKHLEARLRLYYDMKNGTIPPAAGEHLHSLITEAKRLQVKQEVIESEMENSDIDDDNDVNVNDANIQALMEIHIRMREIKNEVDIFENPLLKNALVKKYQELSLVSHDTKQNIWIIYGEGTVNECIQFLSKVEVLYPDQVLKFSPQLWSALAGANPDDVIILNETTHSVKHAGALECGGLLKGISSFEKTILTSDVENIMLDFRGDNVVLENLTIEATSPQCAIIVRKGQLTLNNCKLVGDGRSSTHQGIIVLNGGDLEIINCDISNFFTAIVGNSGSNISIEDSEIHDCCFGLKIYDNCTLKAIKATIRNCRNYGICVETENNLADHPQIGDFDTLNIIPTLQMECIRGNNNIKGDAVINQKSKLQAVEDLLDNSEPTLHIESDEEMDTYQATVIENQACNGRTSPATI